MQDLRSCRAILSVSGWKTRARRRGTVAGFGENLHHRPKPGRKLAWDPRKGARQAVPERAIEGVVAGSRGAGSGHNKSPIFFLKQWVFGAVSVPFIYRCAVHYI
jgi:hypothetical protein